MSETLVVVIILLILFALVIPALFMLQRNLRQKELDAKAEIIYMAAQEQLVNMHASGNTYTEGTKLTDVSSGQYPSDMLAAFDEDGNPVVRSFNFISNVKPASSKTKVLPQEVIDEELRSNNWIIEYDPTNGTVYAVYYSVKKDVDFEYPSQWSVYDTLRDKKERIKAGALVGYYGGDAVAMGGDGSSFKPTITVINAETLSVNIKCNAFSGITNMEFELKLTDADGHSYTEKLTTAGGTVTRLGRSFVSNITLDSLKTSADRFYAKYGPGSDHPEDQKLVPGQKLTIEVKARAPGNDQYEQGLAKAETNSLFAQETTDTDAYIAYGRHLQNLDTDSGVTPNLTKVVQMYDITFGDDVDNAKDWYTLYSSGTGAFCYGKAREQANFKPIVNDNITEYNGSGKRVELLNVYASNGNNAGLFDHLKGGTEVKDLYLTAPYVRSDSGNAGGLAGTVYGAGNKITNVGLYLGRPNINNIVGNKDRFNWITGAEAGGLVGSLTGGSLNVSNSFASTVIDAGNHAGGLIGYYTGGTLRIDNSYADNYIYAENTGGLVSSNNDTSVDLIENCYSAGFQTGTTSEAGLVNGNAHTVRNAYTVVAKKSEEKDGAVYYSTARYIGNVGDVYYLTSSNRADNITGTSGIGSMSKSALRGRLGDAFETDTSDAFLYNLMNQGLTGYDYPCLVANRHYGDWKAAFSDGYLVYYERYDDGSYGFYGANVRSTLKSSGTVVGDGYGLIYKGGGGIPWNKVYVNGSRLDMPTNPPSVRSGSSTYYIFPLDVDTVNPDHPEDTFYSEVRVHTEVDGVEDDKFFYNPLFAKTVVHTDTKPSEAPPEISIRSPRHLYNLSLHYDRTYRPITSDSTYKQERSLDYSKYKWRTYTPYISSGSSGNTINEQQPIGAAEDKAFIARYDGSRYTITDVSFITNRGSYVGMFGYNKGTISNVALVTDYDPDSSKHYIVQRKGNVTSNQTLHMGVLAGYNAGSIEGCAVAGYYIAGADGTIHAYSNSTVYAGGLVGTNTKSIRNSTADCPEIRASALYANVAVGGFAGRNTGDGSISNSYALGYVEIAEAKSGNVTAAGFAGSNQGTINKSYCATAIRVSGDSTSHGFSPYGGAVSDCVYLNQGTYSYIDTLYIYSFDSDITSGSPITYKALTDAASPSATAQHTYNHPNTYNGASRRYPFRSVLRDSSGSYAHYGDWLIEAVLGERGVFYWEKEEEGSNNGVHFTYLGLTPDGKKVTGSTLCNAHDDGGRITTFGYGYYTHGSPSASVTVNGLETSGSTVNGEIKTAMFEQLPSYTFYPYTTKMDSEGDYIRLDNQDRRFGTMTLNVSGLSGSVSFDITPFFANAMKMNGTTDNIILTTSDWRTANFKDAAGTESNTYEIRSADQFAYLNWNHATQNCSTLVYGEENKQNVGNYKQFPFLQYATVLTKGTQAPGPVYERRAKQYWVQTHDVREVDKSKKLTPVAGMATSTPVSNGNYRDILYTWFGGSYDGQNYKIQNINIESEAYTVGLFGATSGADIKNIILFSNNDSEIKRATEGKTAVQVAGKSIDFEKGPGAYFIGGLIALAYDYKENTIKNTIENCAIAGYKVIDQSTNQQGAGTANVGGLIGLANVNLERSSAVADIVIDCIHPYGHMAWGSYFRIGGLAGSAGAPGATLSVRDCYSGGSISVTDRSLNEKPLTYDASKQTATRDKSATSMFVSGMIGGSYAPNISNFSNQDSNSPDGTAHIDNCYTYVELPDLSGNVRAVSYFANLADRYGRGSRVYLNNCYYYVAREIGYEAEPEYYFTPVNSAKRKITQDEFNKMLLGDLEYLKWMLNNQSGSTYKTDGVPREVSFDELRSLSSSLGSAWAPVTVTDEGGGDVTGKYSFSSLDAQIGKNYPFPTVVRQKDLTFSTKTNTVNVNVHYGRWPFDGWYWEKGRDSMDIFADMDDSSGFATKEFYLHYKDPRDTLDFEYSDPGIAEVVGYTIDTVNKRYKVTVKALGTGAVTITESNNDVSFVLSVTGKLTLSSEPEELLLFHEKPEDLTLLAKAEGGKSYEKKGIWNLSSDLNTDENRIIDWEMSPAGSNIFKVTGNDAGTGTIEADFIYTYNGKEIKNAFAVPVRSLGYIGLYNNARSDTTAAAYDGYWRWTDNKQGPSEVRMPEGSELFLFGSGADGDLKDFNVDKITLNGTEVSVGKKISDIVSEEESGRTYTAGDYKLIFGDSISTSGDYSIIPAYIRYSGSGTASDATVKFDITDPVKDSESSSKSYELAASGIKVPEYVVSFDKNADDATGTMYEVGISGSTYKVPECRFRRPGYMFMYWTVGEGSEQYIPGDEDHDTVTGIAGDFTLKAHWKANEYRLDFDANTGTGEIDSVYLLYDQEYTLPKVNVDPPEIPPISKDGFEFTGWNTSEDGSGDSYEDGAAVKGLTTEESIVLYAQWRKIGFRITLMNGTEQYWSDMPTGDSLENSGYEEPQVPPAEGWELDGWYTSTDASAEKLLDPSGRILIADYPGVSEGGEFKLTGDVTLYALWTKELYLPVSELNKASDSGDYSDADGTYVLVSRAEAGARKTLKSINQGSGRTDIGSGDITVLSGSVLDKDMQTCNIFVAEADERAVWTVKFALYNNNAEAPTYSFENAYNSSHNYRFHYLRSDNGNNGDEMQLETNSDNNKHRWVYSDNVLRTEFRADPKSTSKNPNRSIYWDETDNRWTGKDVTPMNKTYLFRLEPAYSFDPASLPQ